jgi:hypothetical protein
VLDRLRELCQLLFPCADGRIVTIGGFQADARGERPQSESVTLLVEVAPNGLIIDQRAGGRSHVADLDPTIIVANKNGVVSGDAFIINDHVIVLVTAERDETLEWNDHFGFVCDNEG